MIWNWIRAKVPEGMILPWWALIVRAVLYPLDFISWLMSQTQTSYRWSAKKQNAREQARCAKDKAQEEFFLRLPLIPRQESKMIYTSLNKIKSHQPCKEGWKKLLSTLGKTEADDEPLSFIQILDSNGLDDALWCARSAPEYAKEWRLYAAWCARQVLHLNSDPRVLKAIEAAEAFALGRISMEELGAARDAAKDAAKSAQEAEFRRICLEGV